MLTISDKQFPSHLPALQGQLREGNGKWGDRASCRWFTQALDSTLTTSPHDQIPEVNLTRKPKANLGLEEQAGCAWEAPNSVFQHFFCYKCRYVSYHYVRGNDNSLPLCSCYYVPGMS